MIMIVIILLSSVWLLVSYLLAKFFVSLLCNFKNSKFLWNSASAKYGLMILVFLFPVLPYLGSYFYIKSKVPVICTQMNASASFEPMIVNSIISQYPLWMISIKHMEQVYWVKTRRSVSAWSSNFEPGVYSFGYYPEGTPECLTLDNYYPKARETIERGRELIDLLGLPINFSINSCVGVSEVEQVEAEYEFSSDAIINVENDYGVFISKYVKKLQYYKEKTVVGEAINVIISGPTYIVPSLRAGPFYCEVPINIDLGEMYNNEEKAFVNFMREHMALLNFE